MILLTPLDHSWGSPVRRSCMRRVKKVGEGWIGCGEGCAVAVLSCCTGFLAPSLG
jgi:hypothetical protein